MRVSIPRRHVVIDEITVGSDPHLRFYALLIASAMIACFGLAANSTAVIIGAMLVSPLMMPIFGIALGMLQGDSRLLGRALLAETGGAVLAVAAAYLVGLFQLTAGEATGEMLSRTQPNLIDLLVAVFAGFAGAYAMIDERISPALPGVAIATAIVPPLSTCGLCLSMGAWSGAGGALLLFLANFVSILMVALGLFWATGVASPREFVSWSSWVRRFGPAAMAFAVVAVILTNSLIHIVRERYTEQQIEATLSAQMAEDIASELDEFSYDREAGRVQVLATVRSPRVVKPGRVSAIQEKLRTALREPVDLVVRTVLSKDVTPTDSSLIVTRPNLDGSFLTSRAAGSSAKEALAEQVIREVFENEPGFELTNVEYGTSSRGRSLVLGYMNTVRRVSAREVELLEAKLRERLQEPELMLVLRVNTGELEFKRGPIRVEWTEWSGATDYELVHMPELEKQLRQFVQETLGVIPIQVHFNLQKDRKRVLIEVVGPQPVSPQDAALLQDRVNQQIETPIEVYLWYRSEFVVNRSGYTTYENLSDPELATRTLQLRKMFGANEDLNDPEVAATEDGAP